jgi:hypothetical protein
VNGEIFFLSDSHKRRIQKERVGTDISGIEVEPIGFVKLRTFLFFLRIWTIVFYNPNVPNHFGCWCF